MYNIGMLFRMSVLPVIQTAVAALATPDQFYGAPRCETALRSVEFGEYDPDGDDEPREVTDHKYLYARQQRLNRDRWDLFLRTDTHRDVYCEIGGGVWPADERRDKLIMQGLTVKQARAAIDAWNRHAALESIVAKLSAQPETVPAPDARPA